MAIRTMTSKVEAHLPNVEKVSNYPGHEEGLIRHGALCVLHGTKDTSGAFSPFCARPGHHLPGEDKQLGYGGHCDGPFEALYMKTTYEGRVLSLGERNGYHDSDFYAVVWTGSHTAQVQYASTRGWSYPNGAWVDATPEVLEAYKAFQATQREAAEKAREKARKAAAEKAAKIPKKGDQVVVVGGRKVKQGTEGKILWVGPGSYGKTRALLATSDKLDAKGKHLDTTYIDLRWLTKATLQTT